MTDKVQKIREEVEKLKSNLVYEDCSSQVSMGIRCKEEEYNEVLSILNTVQAEPKFNVGDTIYNKELTVFIYGISGGKYWVKDVSDTFDFGYLEISKQDEWECIPSTIHEQTFKADDRVKLIIIKED